MSTLEDNVEDILQKAAHGNGLTSEQLAERSGLDPAEITATLRGQKHNADTLRKLADILDIDADQLIAIATNDYVPQVGLPENAWCVTTDYSFMRVNAYLVANPTDATCLIFDAGADSTPLINHIREHKLQPTHLFLTHTHPDHVAAIPGFTDTFPDIEIMSSSLEPWKAGTHFTPGDSFSFNPLRVETRLTAGHSPGGTTYVVHGLDTPLALVGDALFAGSIGGPKISYKDALTHIRQHILSLPDHTILGPGHGPITTVALEKAHNPFFS